MTALKYMLAILIGTGIAFVINHLFSKTIENKTHRRIVKILSLCTSVIICVLFVVSTEVKNYASNILDLAIQNVENKANEFLPELLTEEYDASSIDEVADKLARLQTEILDETDANSENFLTKLVLGNFSKLITDGTENFTNKISYFQKENGKISVDSFLQGTKSIALQKVVPYFIMCKIFVFLLFAVYIILSVCIALYFKGGKKIYNRSIQFGEENTFIGMKNNF